MVNLEYLEQLINSMEKATYNYESLDENGKVEVKNLSQKVSNEINKVLTQDDK